MLFNGIDDFESKFKLFDRLNVLVFNVWRDKKALAYRDSDVSRITNEWRNYVSRARSLSEEVNKMEQDLQRKYSEIEKAKNNVLTLSYNPEINGCGIYHAQGSTQERNPDGTPGREVKTKPVRFVARRGTEQDIAASMVGACDKVDVRLDMNL